MPKFRVFEGSQLGAYTQSPLGARNRIPLPPGEAINPIIFIVGANRPITRDVWKADMFGLIAGEQRQIGPWSFIRTEEMTNVTPNYDDVAKWDADVTSLAEALQRSDTFNWAAHGRFKPNYKLFLIQTTTGALVQRIFAVFGPSQNEEWGIIVDDFRGDSQLLRAQDKGFPSSVHYSTMAVPTNPASQFIADFQAIPGVGVPQAFLYSRFAPTVEEVEDVRNRMVEAFRREFTRLLGNDTLAPLWRVLPPDGIQRYQVIIGSAPSGFGHTGGATPNQPVHRLPPGTVEGIIDEITSVGGASVAVNYNRNLQSGRWLDQFARRIDAEIP